MKRIQIKMDDDGEDDDDGGRAFTWTSLPRLTLEELFLTKVLFRVQAHQLPV